MKAKTLVQLLGLSVSLYTLSKDEELKEKVKELAKKGKEKITDLYEDLSGKSEDELTEKIMATALKAKEELDRRIQECAGAVYEKMHIAHAKDLARLSDELKHTKEELHRAEVRLVALENSTL